MKESREVSLHWSQQNEEVTGYWQLKFLLVVFRIFPVLILRLLAFPIGFFYFIFSKRVRAESHRFLRKVSQCIDDSVLAKKCRSSFRALRHILSFSLSLIEKIQSWGGKFPFKDIHFQNDNITDLIRDLEVGKGALLICSHLGNAELLRGLTNFDRTGVSRKILVTVIVDTKVTVYFNRMLKELNPQSGMDIISTEEIGPETAVLLEDRLAKGGLVAIAGDRTSAMGGNNIMIPFLGKEAPFPSGVFHLASIMNAAIYFVFGLRQKDLSLRPKYNMHVHKSYISFDCTRKERMERSLLLAQSFASFLEGYCKRQPFQWYNFFDFWQERG